MHKAKSGFLKQRTMLAACCALLLVVSGCESPSPQDDANAEKPMTLTEAAQTPNAPPATEALDAPDTDATPENLIANGGLEGDYTDGLAPGWDKSGDTITVSEERDDVHGGSAAQRVKTGDGYDFVASFLGDAENEEPVLVEGTQYELSFAIKVLSGELSRIRILAENEPQYESKDPFTDADWKVYRIGFVANSTMNKAKIFFVNGADKSGEYLLDDVLIRRDE